MDRYEGINAIPILVSQSVDIGVAYEKKVRQRTNFAHFRYFAKIA
jgi:hypothetical protein